MLRDHLKRVWMFVALFLAVTASAAAATVLRDCPTYDPNVDCWSADEGWCPDHCKTACTVEY